MKKIRKITWVLLVLGCLSTPAAFGQRCGKERWSVKTGTDTGASQINLSNPQTATIANLITLQPPNPLPTNSRFAPTENTVFVVDATLTDFKVETGSTGDSDYHLVLQDDQGNTMVAEIPLLVASERTAHSQRRLPALAQSLTRSSLRLHHSRLPMCLCA